MARGESRRRREQPKIGPIGRIFLSRQPGGNRIMHAAGFLEASQSRVAGEDGGGGLPYGAGVHTHAYILDAAGTCAIERDCDGGAASRGACLTAQLRVLERGVVGEFNRGGEQGRSVEPVRAHSPTASSSLTSRSRRSEMIWTIARDPASTS